MWTGPRGRKFDVKRASFMAPGQASHSKLGVMRHKNELGGQEGITSALRQMWKEGEEGDLKKDREDGNSCWYGCL